MSHIEYLAGEDAPYESDQDDLNGEEDTVR